MAGVFDNLDLAEYIKSVSAAYKDEGALMGESFVAQTPEGLVSSNKFPYFIETAVVYLNDPVTGKLYIMCGRGISNKIVVDEDRPDDDTSAGFRMYKDEYQYSEDFAEIVPLPT